MAPNHAIRLGISLAAALGFCGLSRFAAAGPMYTATMLGPIRTGSMASDPFDLGAPSYHVARQAGFWSRPPAFTGDLNESAQVVGAMSWPGVGNERPTVYGGVVDSGRVHELGTLGGSSGQALGINDAGVAVGNARDVEGNARPAVFQDGQVRDLGTLGGATGTATAINDQGQVVGHAQVAPGDSPGDSPSHAFLVDTNTGTMKDLGTLGGGSSYATDINDQGQVVGASTTSPAGLSSGSSSGDALPSHAFIADTNTGAMQDLGTLGGPTSEATAINDQGQVVGFSTVDADAGQTRAFLHEQGTMRDLGTLGGTSSWARDINETGKIVGESLVHSVYGYERLHAFLYDGGKMLDLNDLVETEIGVELARATAINDAGQILVETAPQSFWNDGSAPGTRSVLLTPLNLPPPPAATPEPSTWILFATLCLPLMYRAKRAAASRAVAR